MYGFYVILSAETASFRDPGGQLYHATLPLPPVSTIVGIAGAALGQDFQQAWQFSKEHGLKVGVRSMQEKNQGKGLDLWKYQKIVTKEVRSDILKREFLFRPRYRLCYACESRETVEQLQAAFLDPAWALSLGTSDDIVRVEHVSPVKKISEIDGKTVDLKHSLVPGDQTESYTFDWDIIRSKPVRTSLELPIVKQLPVDYSFTGNGERKGSRYLPFTFLSGTHSLKTATSVYDFGEDAVALISVRQGELAVEMEYAKPYAGEKGMYAFHIGECHRLWQELFQSREGALRHFCRNVGLPFDDLRNKMERAILFHDAGKLLPTFQQQMLRLINNGPADRKLHFRHELASTAVLLFADRKILARDTVYIPYDILAVLGHHKPLQYDWNSFEREKSRKQSPGLDKAAVVRILQVAERYGLNVDVEVEQAASIFASPHWVCKILDFLQRRCGGADFDNLSDKKRRDVRLLYAVTKGLLMTCDWLASAEDNSSRIPLNHCLRSPILRQKMKDKVERERRIYEERPFHRTCEQTMGDVLAIAPTGTGKTEAALLWATNCEPTKILFLMPTMVTSNSLYTRMKESYFATNECGLSHSGAATFFAQKRETEEFDENSTDADLRLALRQYRAFLSPVMVATVDQMLTSGFNIGSWCQKEWALVGSRVIFDEVHAFQPYTLGLITAAIEKIKLLGGSVCLMSATMPSFLLEHFKKVLNIKTPIVANELMARQKCWWQYCNEDIDSMSEKILDYLRVGKKVAIVFNTVRAAQMAYQKWKDIWNVDRVLCYHSQFTMLDRQDKEDRLLVKDAEGRPKDFDLVIATQTIEVSLDISFDVMYSECAPLDSLIQRAGRCNRYNLVGDYYFIVFPISDIAYRKVYEKAHVQIDRTADIVCKNQRCLREDELAQMLEYVYADAVLGEKNIEFQRGYQLYDKIAADTNSQGFIFDLPVSEETVTRIFDLLKISIIPHVYYDEVLSLWEQKKYSLIRQYEAPVSEWRRRKLKPVENRMQLPIYEVPYTVEEGILDSEQDLPWRFV